MKAHSGRESFERELLCYLRLTARQVLEEQGFRVPQLIDADEELWVIEMSIVKPPFLLDFGGAYLDRAPDFPAEVMEQWREEKLEQFGDRWPQVETLLDQLRRKYGIHLLDVNPGNIRFE